MVQTLLVVLSTETDQETLGMDSQHSQVVVSGLGIDCYTEINILVRVAKYTGFGLKPL